MEFLQWWGSLSPWVRYPLGLFLLAGSSFLFFAGAVPVWMWAGGSALGVAAIAVSGSDSDRKGYHF